jgi:glucose-6-phosphate 1-dehydrogenase
LPAEARIIGLSRGPMAGEAFIAMARQAIIEHVPEAERSEAAVERFTGRLSYVVVEADEDGGWHDLTAALEPYREYVNVFYLATGPALFGPICERLGRFGLAHANARVVVEKPMLKP